MEKVRYMISDAADMVHVETHVLRYWEEELGLSIPRNEMGHRYYTRENIKELQQIKELKEQGYQLRAIRMILHTGKLDGASMEVGLQAGVSEQQNEDNEGWYVNTMDEDAGSRLDDKKQVVSANYTNIRTQAPVQKSSTLTPEERMSQFRELMSDIVGQAIIQNNEALSEQIGKDVQERVLKEMNYLMREQDEAQEERYRKLDAAIRGSVRRKSIFSRKKSKE